METGKQKGAPLPTVRRLPTYLRLLRQMEKDGREFVSSTAIADELHLESIQVRKDLAVTGIEGKCRVGYPVSELIRAIEGFLGWDNTTDAFLVGAGSLGAALIGYEGFERHGLNIVAAFDIDDAKVGRPLRGKEVLPLTKFTDLARRMHIRLGIIAAPAEAAPSIANLMVASGIRAIWNFAPAKIIVPNNVVVQNEDLSSGLAVLSRQLAEILEKEGEA